MTGRLPITQAAIRVRPNYGLAYGRSGLCLRERGATTIRQLTITRRPFGSTRNMPMAYRNRGDAYRKTEQLDKAIVDYTEAIRLNPKYDDAYYNRGLTYQRKGDKQKAEEDFAKAKMLGYKPDGKDR